MASDYEDFIRNALKNTSEPGLLTKRLLHTRYLEQSGKASLSIDEKKVFSDILMTVLNGSLAGESDDAEVEPKTSNGAETQPTGLRDEDEESSGSEFKAKTRKERRQTDDGANLSSRRKRTRESESDDGEATKKAKGNDEMGPRGVDLEETVDYPLEDETDSPSKSGDDAKPSDGSDEDRSEVEESDSDSEVEEAPKKKKKKKDDEKNKKTTKGKNDDNDPKIVRMKRYVTTAGLRLLYVKLFENCKSVKSKVLKLQEALEDAGLKGKPTIEKCKRLKRKRERKKELAELDLGNILTDGEGRSRRNVRDPFAITRTRVESRRETVGDPTKKRFSRLKDVVDSEESSD